MRTSFTAEQLLGALAGPSLVEPKPDLKAYLFRCYRDEAGQPRCRIYSRRESLAARGGLALHSLDGEGSFAFPVEHLGMLRTLPPEDLIDLEYTETAGEGYRLRLRASSGMHYDHTTFDPRLFSPVDRDFQTAASGGMPTVSAGVLGVGLNLAKEFLPRAGTDDHVKEHFQTVRLFDDSNPSWAKGNGTLFAADGTRAFYFQCDALRGAGLVLHRDQISTVAGFLPSCSSGKVAVCSGPFHTFVVDGDDAKIASNKDALVGWARRIQTHVAYAYPRADVAQFVFRLAKDQILKAIEGARVTIARGPDGRVFVRYSHADHQLRLRAGESAGTFESSPVRAHPEESSVAQDFSYTLQLRHLNSLIADCKGNEVHLRVRPFEKTETMPRPGAMFSTIEQFTVDVHGRLVTVGPDRAAEVSGAPETFACRVTRCAPSLL